MGATRCQWSEVLQGVKQAEADARRGTEGRRLETGGKLSIAISADARLALEGLKDGGGVGRLVQLSIDLKSEEIGLVGTSEVSAEGLAREIINELPRYAFYRYKYVLEGAEQSPLVFIYTCPNGSKVRERMVYASSKEGLVAAARADIGLDVAKKVWNRDSSVLEKNCLQSCRSSKFRIPQRSRRQRLKKSSNQSKRRNKAFRDRRGLAEDDNSDCSFSLPFPTIELDASIQCIYSGGDARLFESHRIDSWSL